MSGKKEKEEEMESTKGREELHLNVINNFNTEQEKRVSEVRESNNLSITIQVIIMQMIIY